ncbi:hypothetical protein COOONC_22520 [Cooperia oncophora]
MIENLIALRNVSISVLGDAFSTASPCVSGVSFNSTPTWSSRGSPKSVDDHLQSEEQNLVSFSSSPKNDSSADVGTSSPEHGQSEEHALDGSSAESHDTTSREREQLTEIVDDPSDTIQAAEPVTIAYEYLLQQNVLHPTLLKGRSMMKCSSARNSGEVPKMKNKTIAERSRRHLVLNDRVDIWTKIPFPKL